MREGRIRPSLARVGKGRRRLRSGGNEGGANSPLVGYPEGPEYDWLKEAAMREGRIRPSLAINPLGASTRAFAAMREGRIRPSLVYNRHAARQDAVCGNEGGANSPLVGRTFRFNGTQYSLAAMREGRIRPSLENPRSPAPMTSYPRQ